LEEIQMGIVRTEITLKNAVDVDNAQNGIIKEPEIRQTVVQAVVDTGALTLVINEELRRQLGLRVVGTMRTTLADNTKKTVKVAAPTEVHWKNRSMVCQPWVVDSGNVLLGAIPLENMDLMVDPRSQTVAGVHGEEEVLLLL
jgi:clan AA aspartic protease